MTAPVETPEAIDGRGTRSVIDDRSATQTVGAEQDQEQWGTGLNHAWCLRCLLPAPHVATAFCGFKTRQRRNGKAPKIPSCVVCMELWPLGCERCGQ